MAPRIFYSVFMKPILSCLQSFCMAFFISSLILSSCSNDGVISGTEKINVSVTSVSGNEMSFSIAENNYESVTWLVLEKENDRIFNGAEELFGVAGIKEASPFYVVEGLYPETEYVLYVAVRYYNGKYSGISISDFKTVGLAKGFDFGVGYVNYAAFGLSHLIPKDMERYYYLTVQTRSDFENIYGGVEGIGEYYYAHPEFDRPDKGMLYGDSYEVFYDIDAVLFWHNRDNVPYLSVILPDTEYVFAVWYVDEVGRPTSEVECAYIRTLPLPEKSPLEIRLDCHTDEVGELDYIRLLSNSKVDDRGRLSRLYFEPHFVKNFFVESEYLRDCKSDMEIANKTARIYKDAAGIQGELGIISNLVGTEEAIMIRLENLKDETYRSCFWPEYKPDTEYVMCAFATYCGKILSDPAVVRFKTPADPVF